MKTIFKITLLIIATITIIIILGTSLPTNSVNTANLNPPIFLELSEEGYIDDIPFDTSEISFQETFKLDEEEYNAEFKEIVKEKVDEYEDSEIRQMRESMIKYKLILKNLLQVKKSNLSLTF